MLKEPITARKGSKMIEIFGNVMHKLNLSATKYLIGAASDSQFPPDLGMEVAFAGRSNSGKSSTINAITNINGIARTSKTPGRTQLINFFTIEKDKLIVDLPGYGYAKVNEKMKRSWGALISNYITHRQSLQGVFLIMDIRHPLKQYDWQLIELAGYQRLPIHILLNKADKLKRGAANSALMKVKKQLSGYEDIITIQLFSAFTDIGVLEAQEKLKYWLTH